MRRIFTILGLVTAPFTWSGEPTVPDFTFQAERGILTLLPPPAHHFNKESPTRLTSEAKTLVPRITEKKISVSLKGLRGPIQATVYLCDDAKTYCLKKTQTYDPAGTSKATSFPSPSAAPKAKTGIDGETSFLVNDPDRAFALAAEKRKPLIVDFFGIWCPPCNHLDAMVLKSRTFRAKTDSGFVKLKLDADDEVSAQLKEKYKIRGLPTILFLTPNGDEIFRVLGFRPLEEMIKKADLAWENRETGFEKLSTLADAGNRDARYKAAMIALDRNEGKRALQWLLPLKGGFEERKDPRLENYYRARSMVAAEASDVPQSIQALNDWIQAFPKSFDALDAYQTLSSLLEEQKQIPQSQEVLRSGIAAVNEWLARPVIELDRFDATPGDLHQLKAEMLSQLGQKAEATQEYLKCVAAYEKQGAAEKSSFARGPSLEKAYCLAKAGKVDESEAIYRDGIRRFPTEYTFHAHLGQLELNYRNNAGEALKQARQALRYAYGNQRLKTTLLEVKALEKLGNAKEAISRIDAELQAGVAGTSTSLRRQLEKKKTDLLSALQRG